jgi:hypothetical protein
MRVVRQPNGAVYSEGADERNESGIEGKGRVDLGNGHRGWVERISSSQAPIAGASGQQQCIR